MDWIRDHRLGPNAQMANEHLKGSSADSQLYGGTVVHLPRLDRRRHSDRVLQFAVSSEDETPAQIAQQLGMACAQLVQEWWYANKSCRQQCYFDEFPVGCCYFGPNLI